MSKNILMVLDAAFPPDIRVEKEASSLMAGGYTVTLLCPATQQLPKEASWNSMRILRNVRFGPGGSLRKLDILIAGMAFVSPSWKQAIREYARSERPDAVHVHDLPLVSTALSAVRGLGIPVVADLHENYPEAVREHEGLRGRGLRAAVKGYLYDYPRWTRQEGEACARADRVIAVVEEMKDRLIRQHGLDPGKIVVVTNTEQMTFVDQAEVDLEIVRRYEDTFLLLYIGSYGPHRGLETVIDGAALLRKSIPNLRVAIVGKGNPKFDEQLKILIDGRSMADIVDLVGWQPFSKVYSYMKAATVGLVPHHRNEQTDNTIPHKLFQLMMTGTPLLVSSCRPLARVVEATGAGRVFEASDAEDFAEKTLSLYLDNKARAAMAERGRSATLNGPWNWESTCGALLDLYDKLL